jgi:hypothetical protein
MPEEAAEKVIVSTNATTEAEAHIDSERFTR